MKSSPFEGWRDCDGLLWNPVIITSLVLTVLLLMLVDATLLSFDMDCKLRLRCASAAAVGMGGGLILGGGRRRPLRFGEGSRGFEEALLLLG